MRCDLCGFDYDTVSRDDVVPRIQRSTAATSRILRSGDDDALRYRPSPSRWSATEYGAHIRDVLITIRDRLVIGLVEDVPDLKPMYRDERVDLGLYQSDPPGAVSTELDAASAMFGRLFLAIEPAKLDRLVNYGYPSPHPRSLLWMGVQAVHECEHHHTDILEDLTAWDTR